MSLPESLEEVAACRAIGRNEIEDWCDDCAKFKNGKCEQGSKMLFHAPNEWREVMELKYGYYNLFCTSRVAR